FFSSSLLSALVFFFNLSYTLSTGASALNTKERRIYVVECFLTPSDIIEIISIIVSAVVSIVAIAISLKSLKQSRITNEQNNRLLEESTRPYITIYLDAITICEQTSYFVLKNFGNSPA